MTLAAPVGQNQDCQDVCIDAAAMLAGQIVNVKR